MRFSELTPIQLNVISQSSVYSNSQTRPHLHDWQLDWRRLYTLINDNSEQLLEVKAGLAEDWVRTHGTVWDVTQGFHRRPNDSYDYDDTVFWGYSSWATPTIVVTFADEREAAFALYTHGMDYNYHYLGYGQLD